MSFTQVLLLYTKIFSHTVSHTATFQSQVDLRKTTFTRENKKGQVEITQALSRVAITTPVRKGDTRDTP